MRALITGGAGFIGSHLADALIDRGYTVLVLDDLSTGRRDNIAHLQGHSRFHMTIGSVIDESVVAPLVRRADIVFHLAAVVGVRLVVENPVRTVETNVVGTSLILRLAAACGAKVVFASSSEVYGRGVALPYREDVDLPLGSMKNRRWSYACSKATGESMALAHAREHDLPVVIARLFNTVGPRQLGDYGMVMPRFAAAALAGAPLTIFGDGRQSRCFTYVEDTVEALIELAAHPKARGEVFNIGSETEIAILDLARTIKAMTGSASPIVHIRHADAYGVDFADVTRRVPDLARIRALIGYGPDTSLEATLERTIAWTLSRDSRPAAMRAEDPTPLDGRPSAESAPPVAG